MKKQPAKEQGVGSRRAFLKGAATAGGAAALVASTGSVAATVQPQAAASDGTGYRETDHVRGYYKSARF
tara:strand:- start:57 stop:263 length:207 start_codon:yes stop_codon:yes gene_type:complete